VWVCTPLDTSIGEGGIESGKELDAPLWKEVDCSVSETSDESVLLTSSRDMGRRTG
jgi:hypothetical protein